MGWFSDGSYYTDSQTPGYSGNGGSPMVGGDADKEKKRQEQLQNEQMELQNKALNQKTTSDWEASRAQLFHPYDNMPVERMALDQHSPLFTSPGKPQFSWADELAPQPAMDMSRRPVPQSQWDASFANSKLNAYNREVTDTPQGRLDRAALDYYGKVAGDITSPEPARQDARTKAAEVLSRSTGTPMASTGQPGATPPPKAAGQALSGPVSMPQDKVLEEDANDRIVMGADGKKYIVSKKSGKRTPLG